MKKPTYYTTTDKGFAAALMTIGVKFVRVSNIEASDEIIEFIFYEEDAIDELHEKYYGNNLPVNARDLAHNYMTLNNYISDMYGKFNN